MADGAPVHVVGLLGGRPVGADATAALAQAVLVAGGRDQLAAVADLIPTGARTVTVGAGLGALEAVVSHPGPTCVLASGDPGFFGIVRALAGRVGGERLVVHPAPSSVALAFARLGLPWDGAVVRSCHAAGGAARAAAEVARAEVAAVLTGPDAPPEAVGAALVALGAHHRLVVVATRLGEPGEQVVRCTDLADLAAGRFDHRSVVVLAHPASPRSPAGHGGRPVAAFAHRSSMITKPEVRSVVLGRLDLPGRGVLWDVGAGSGSVAVEAALAAPGLRVITVERNHDDAERVLANAAALGAMVDVVEGAAPEALAPLPPPDRVFVGGGGLDVLVAGLDALRPGGRLVATFAAVDRAVAAHQLLGNLVQVGVDRAQVLPDGGVRFEADNPVFVAWGDKPGPADAQASPATRVVVGVGCSSEATADEVAAVVDEALRAAGDLGDAPVELATIDARSEHPATRAAAARTGARLLTFPASLLGAVDVPNPSDVVAGAVGTPSVAEAAALLGAGPRARLVVTKRKGPTATAAVAAATADDRPATTDRPGSLHIVGLGPGAAQHRTPAATTAVRQADAVVGYGPYVDAIVPLLRPDQLVVRSSMGAETDRALAALALARAGWRVALVSSGDPGVFAMAARTLDLAANRPEADVEIEIVVVPGVTAAHAAAAAAGAPLGGAHALLTLSDLLVPWPTIEAHLRAAAESGMALALYNPRSAGRPDHLARAQAVLLDALDPSTRVVVVTDATGPAQSVVRTTLSA
ncbi:MAG: cobalt-precorrin hydrolase / cobalt-factor methyltransferase / precorrin-3B, partial [Actinomycetota bacterium]|nr:cobalt-precorrin hydrolase / cobalt-factor methyltransferase / precorrin-3B [Actinomycetota bacterium]